MLQRACQIESLESRRLLTAIDPSFGDNGLVTTDITGAGSTDTGYDVAVQSDGKIVMVGSSGSDFAITRYNSDGSLDTGFNSTGILDLDMGGTDAAHGVAIDANGKIVVVGTSAGKWALARLNTDGSLDTTFDSNGKAYTDLNSSTDDVAWSTVIDPSSGKIYAAGTGSDISGHPYVFICRYTTSGSLDTSWDGDGKKATTFSNDNIAYKVQLDGRIVIAGMVSGDFLVARYDTDATFDLTCSGDGRQPVNFGSTDTAYGLAIQPADGKIVVSGSTGTGTASQFALARLTTSGSMDTTFDSDGKATTSFGATAGAVAYDVAVLPGGRSLRAGPRTVISQLRDILRTAHWIRVLTATHWTPQISMLARTLRGRSH